MTPDEERIFKRLRRLEEAVNDLIVAQNKNATLSQVQELLIIYQTELESLGIRTEALEARLEMLENDGYSDED